MREAIGMAYQDLIIDGVTIYKGERECQNRYAVVKAFCEGYKRPFTVLDIGAAQGYFCRRLVQDFSDCTAVAIESDMPFDDDYKELPDDIPYKDIARFFGSSSERIIWLRHHFTLDELGQLAEVEHFDVVLALSVLHHFGGSFRERLELFKSLGDHLIFELAYEDAACGGEQKKFDVPPNAELLGYGDSHLEKDGQREIRVISAMKTSLRKAYLGSPRRDEDLQLVIYSDFISKRARFYNKMEIRDWHRGLNLLSFLKMSGVHPSRAVVANKLAALDLSSRHGDIHSWNVILQGDAVKLIDAGDPNMQVEFDDSECMAKLLEEVNNA